MSSIYKMAFAENYEIIFDDNQKINFKGSSYTEKTVSILLISGGGHGGDSDSYPGQGGGGGGAGGWYYNTGYTLLSGTYPITIGGNREISTFNGLGPRPGGDGGPARQPGGRDACGGGGGAGNNTAGTVGGTGDQGGDGGHSGFLANGGGGGGGASGDGGGTESGTGGNGGAGLEFPIFDNTKYLGGGGGGGTGTGYGDTWGGGNGNGNGAPRPNSGGGGGGGNYSNPPTAGATGIFKIRYLTSDFPSSSGGDVTTDGDYTIRTFNDDGTLVLG